MRNRLIFITTCVFLFFCSGLAHATGNSADHEILATVGNETLTMKRLSLMVQGMSPQYQAMVKNMPEVKNDLIRNWTETTLLSQEAIGNGLDKDPVVALKLEEMKNRILVEFLILKKIDTQTPVSDSEILNYYDSHPDEFIQGELVKAQHILIRTDQDVSIKEQSNKEQSKAMEQITEIQKRLQQGESFMELAKEFSEDFGSKDKGGDLGYFGKGHMVPEFEDAAFSTAVGQVCPPVKTQYGFHLIKVNDKTEPMQIPFEKISQKLEETLRAERNHKALQNLLSELKEKYPVTIY